jgi:hypothetical protein
MVLIQSSWSQPMYQQLKKRFVWLLGIWTAWGTLWLLLGLRGAIAIHRMPHPFLPGARLTESLRGPAIEWAVWALVAHLLIGLILGVLAQIVLSVGHKEHFEANLSYAGGLGLGAASLVWFHALLYLSVPSAMGILPLLKAIPMGLALLILLVGGAWLLWKLVAIHAKSFRLLRWFGLLVVLTTVTYLPHDVFRRLMPSRPPLSKEEPRLAIISVDAMRQDLLEKAIPEWKAPNGAQPVCAVPATRLAWSLLFGDDSSIIYTGGIAARPSELARPDRHRLLAFAERKGLRTAFLINDSLTPSFGLEPNLFSSEFEPQGGWKYWFTLGYGTFWPTYSWAQNFASPVETTNPWADPEAYLRDIDRALREHHWVSSHDCTLHAPITLRIQELQSFMRWQWLRIPAYESVAYFSPQEVLEDKGARTGTLGDAKGHYLTRIKFTLQKMKPWVERWEVEYPNLSGVVTADHGEFHMPVLNAEGKISTHLNGIHGFNLDPDTLRIPMHPFGKTQVTFKPNEVVSWFDLRDGIAHWVGDQRPLAFSSHPEGWLVQTKTVRATHLESDATLQNQEDGDKGIDPSELATAIRFYPNGLWIMNEKSAEALKDRKLSTALVGVSDLVIFNPTEHNRYDRIQYLNNKFSDRKEVSAEEMDREIKSFKGLRPYPLNLPQFSSPKP